MTATRSTYKACQVITLPGHTNLDQIEQTALLRKVSLSQQPTKTNRNIGNTTSEFDEWRKASLHRIEVQQQAVHKTSKSIVASHQRRARKRIVTATED